jgi:ribose transport system ATP-binding protein
MKSRDGFLLETKQLTKAFPGVIAVDNIDFQIRPGEVHALLGENGAGKSTFCKVLSGIYQPTSGQIFFDGHPVTVRSPHDALKVGLSMVYQERNLIGFLSGAENICLGIESGHWGIIDRDEVIKAAVQIRDRIGADVDLGVPVEQLSLSEQQLVEILRALIHNPKLLVLDEPTASLSHNSVNLLHDVIRRIISKGVGVIYISHKLEEVFEVADRVTIMRDGKKVVTETSSELDFDSCIRYMTSQGIDELYPQNEFSSSSKALLEVRGISDGHKTHDVSFKVAAGEIVGFYGLIGAGRTEVANSLFGISPYKTGSVILDGQELAIRKPIDALRHGIFLVPEDRDKKGLFSIFALRGNLTISVIRRFLKLGALISRRLEQQVAETIAVSSDLRLMYSDLNQNIHSLSGGNRQKVLLERWLARQEDARIIIFDEPTQGIDVGVKHEIYELLGRLARERNLGIIFISSELVEVLGISDRIYVFRGGTIAKEFLRGDVPTQEQVLAYAF